MVTAGTRPGSFQVGRSAVLEVRDGMKGPWVGEMSNIRDVGISKFMFKAESEERNRFAIDVSEVFRHKIEQVEVNIGSVATAQ